MKKSVFFSFQTILSSVIFALVAGAAVDSAHIAGGKSVAKRDLWQSLAEMSGHMAGVQSYGAPTAGDWSRAGFESRMIAPDHYHGTGSGSGAAAEQLRVASHPVHEWHQEEEQSSGHEWRPYHEEPRRHHAVATHSKEASREEHTQEEWKDDLEDEKHGKDTKEHHHHHHHHVKVIEVPKPYPVHVDKPYPIYVEKPVIVEKHVPLKLYIKKKVHH